MPCWDRFGSSVTFQALLGHSQVALRSMLCWDRLASSVTFHALLGQARKQRYVHALLGHSQVALRSMPCWDRFGSSVTFHALLGHSQVALRFMPCWDRLASSAKFPGQNGLLSRAPRSRFNCLCLYTPASPSLSPGHFRAALTCLIKAER